MKFPLLLINTTFKQLLLVVEVCLAPTFDFTLTMLYTLAPIISTQFLVCWKTANYADSYWFLYSAKCGFSEQHFVPTKK